MKLILPPHTSAIHVSSDQSSTHSMWATLYCIGGSSAHTVRLDHEPVFVACALHLSYVLASHKSPLTTAKPHRNARTSFKNGPKTQTAQPNILTATTAAVSSSYKTVRTERRPLTHRILAGISMVDDFLRCNSRLMFAMCLFAICLYRRGIYDVLWCFRGMRCKS